MRVPSGNSQTGRRACRVALDRDPLEGNIAAVQEIAQLVRLGRAQPAIDLHEGRLAAGRLAHVTGSLPAHREHPGRKILRWRVGRGDECGGLGSSWSAWL